MRNAWTMGLGCLVGLSAALPASAAFDDGLFVLRVGATGVGISGAGQQSVYLDEYDISGATASLKRTIAVSASGGDALTLPAAPAIDNGRLTLSTNGQYLLFGGYRANAGAPDSSQTLASSVNRVVGRMTADGTIDTSTALTNAYNGTTGKPAGINTVLSDDGSRFWLAGTVSSVESSTTNSGGLRYVGAVGDTTSTNIGARQTFLTGQPRPSEPDSFRSARWVDGKLYVNTPAQNSFPNRGTYEVTQLFPDALHPQSYNPVIVNLENSVTDAAGNPDDPDGAGKGKWYPKTDAVFLDLDPTVPGVDVAYGTGGKEDYRKWSRVWNPATSTYEWTSSISNVKLLPSGLEINAMDARVTPEGVVLFATLDSGVLRLVDTSGYNGILNDSFNTSSYYITATGTTQLRGLVLVPEPVLTGGLALVGLVALRRRRSA